jgi:hypothetical protein
MSSASGPASSSTKNGANGNGSGIGTPGHKSGAATSNQSSARATKKSAFSCEPCRRRKVKCGGEQPVCSRCLARNDACVYKLWDPLPLSNPLRPLTHPFHSPDASTSPHLTSPQISCPRPCGPKLAAHTLTNASPISHLQARPVLTRLETQRCPTPSAWRSASKTLKSRSQKRRLRSRRRPTHRPRPSADCRKAPSHHRTKVLSLATNPRA